MFKTQKKYYIGMCQFLLGKVLQCLRTNDIEEVGDKCQFLLGKVLL